MLIKCQALYMLVSLFLSRESLALGGEGRNRPRRVKKGEDIGLSALGGKDPRFWPQGKEAASFCVIKLYLRSNLGRRLGKETPFSLL